ncbi:hypothetical protein JXA32_03645 [Candidatus Sumerlaeota bacterium]|nr:hypothetical protein [Candidatus Sumerlaeota bacterium]
MFHYLKLYVVLCTAIFSLAAATLQAKPYAPMDADAVIQINPRQILKIPAVNDAVQQAKETSGDPASPMLFQFDELEKIQQITIAVSGMNNSDAQSRKFFAVMSGAADGLDQTLLEMIQQKGRMTTEKTEISGAPAYKIQSPVDASTSVYVVLPGDGEVVVCSDPAHYDQYKSGAENKLASGAMAEAINLHAGAAVSVAMSLPEGYAKRFAEDPNMAPLAKAQLANVAVLTGDECSVRFSLTSGDAADAVALHKAMQSAYQLMLMMMPPTVQEQQPGLAQALRNVAFSANGNYAEAKLVVPADVLQMIMEKAMQAGAMNMQGAGVKVEIGVGTTPENQGQNPSPPPRMNDQN